MSENTLNIYEQKAEEMTATHIIPTTAKFSRTEGGFISLDLEGKHYDRVKVVRLFPFTDANKYLSIREYGGSSKEIGIIEDLDVMPEETKTLIEHQLSLCYFTPVISKIYNIKDQGSFAVWKATKTTGQYDLKTFEVKARPVEKFEGLRPGMTAIISGTKR